MQLSDNRRNKAIADKTVKGTCIHVVALSTVKGRMSADSPKIPKILKILLPTRFPKAISELSSREEKMFTTNSGADVPKATIVKPIIISETRKRLATDEAPSTKILAP